MDPVGWRYHIPAFMIWTIKNARRSDSVASDGTIYSFDLYVDNKPIETLPSSSKDQRFQWPYIFARPILNLLIHGINFLSKKPPIDPKGLRESSLERFSTLNDDQSRCVYLFLCLMVNSFDDHIDVIAAKRAIDIYWHKYEG
jgi:hypothetical protein